MMRESDIVGLSAEQIKDRYALPRLPALIQDVDVPSGVRMRACTAARVVDTKGVVEKDAVWGNGGGPQLQLIDRIADENFSAPRRL